MEKEKDAEKKIRLRSEAGKFEIDETWDEKKIGQMRWEGNRWDNVRREKGLGYVRWCEMRNNEQMGD